MLASRQALASSFNVVGPPSGQEACRPICEPGLGGLPSLEGVEQLLEQFGRQILVGVLEDLHHRRVGARAQALDRLPGEVAIRRQMVRLVVDTPLAHLFQLIGTAQHARRRVAHLDVRLAPDRGELEHRVERGDLVDPDVGHAEHVGHNANGGLGQPVVVLLLRPPQQRDHGGGLLALGILGDRRLRPGQIFRREGKGGGLLGIKSADGHCCSGLAVRSGNLRPSGFARPWQRASLARTYRSISPNTTSSEPRMAETSASMWPRFMKSMACRWAKPGARILQR